MAQSRRRHLPLLSDRVRFIRVWVPGNHGISLAWFKPLPSSPPPLPPPLLLRFPDTEHHTEHHRGETYLLSTGLRDTVFVPHVGSGCPRQSHLTETSRITHPGHDSGTSQAMTRHDFVSSNFTGVVPREPTSSLNRPTSPLPRAAFSCLIRVRELLHTVSSTGSRVGCAHLV